MAYRISDSVGAYEAGSVNRKADVETIQAMLTAIAKKHGAAFDPKGIDGLISRTASRSSTVTAISNFQTQKIGLRPADKRIDVNGRTWRTMAQLAGTATSPAAGGGTIKKPVTSMITMTVQHGGKIPTKTTFSDGTKSTAGIEMYESTITLSGGGMSGSFKGSIYPDDMTVKGRLVDGTYPLHIGFHKGGGKAKQKVTDLVVRTQGIRAGLLINARNSVSVESNNASKKTSVGVNVHNGFNSKRYSDGCVTIQPSDWSKFIQTFLDGYTNINDWHTVSNNTGKKIGSIIIKR